jgi:hypothetical protein
MVPTYLRYQDLVARGILRNRATLANWIEKCGFPKGRMIGPNSRAWTEEEIDAWLSSRSSENTTQKRGAIRKNLEGHTERAALVSKVNFATVRAALPFLPSLLRTWLPDGRRHGGEWVALNPKRNDRRPGSFSINLQTGRWADFATGDKGGDVVSLAAFIFGTSQTEAARSLAAALGVRVRP